MHQFDSEPMLEYMNSVRMRLEKSSAVVLRTTVLLGTLVASVLATAPPALAQTTGWQAGPGAVLNDTYEGSIDQPINGTAVYANSSVPITGWVDDTTAQGWAGVDSVQIWLGAMNGGGTLLTQAVVAEQRPDVAAALGNPYAAASGFSALVPGSAVPAGSQTLSVYAHTPGKGWWYKQFTVIGGGTGSGASAPAAGAAPVVTITSPTANESLTATGGVQFTITGTVSDPTGGPSAIDSVDVWIYGERNTSGATDLGDATVDGAGNFSLTFKPTQFSDGHTNIYVYAHSKLTGLTTEVYQGFNIDG